MIVLIWEWLISAHELEIIEVKGGGVDDVQVRVAKQQLLRGFLRHKQTSHDQPKHLLMKLDSLTQRNVQFIWRA
jgi:hypothetical protein